MKTRVAWLGIAGAVLLSATAWAADPVAYVTEIHRSGKAEVRVRAGGEADWKAPQPLQALRPGDQLRVSGDGRVVLLYHGGAGVQTITSASSPFTVQAAAPAQRAGQLQVLAAGVSEFLIGKQAPPTYRRLSVRSARTATEVPQIVSPRQTRLLPGPVTFEWDGNDGLRYTVRVSGPDGVLWQQTGLPRRPIAYPGAAPPLRDGVAYTWELQAPGFPAQRSPFELLSDAEAARVREKLAVLARAETEGYPRGTVVLMRVALLQSERLFGEARRELEAALAADREEPTLHTLLGHVYERVGLTARAVDAFERARALARE